MSGTAKAGAGGLAVAWVREGEILIGLYGLGRPGERMTPAGRFAIIEKDGTGYAVLLLAEDYRFGDEEFPTQREAKASALERLRAVRRRAAEARR